MHSEFVYVLRSGPYFKIGRTTDITKRIAQLTIQLPFPVELFKVINTDDSARLESHFHVQYVSSRVNGEWFQLNESAIADLFLSPPSISCKQPKHDQRVDWDPLIDIVADRLGDWKVRREFKQLIEIESGTERNSIPDYIGSALLSDYLAHECPYSEIDDMEWVVADNTDEE